MPKKLEINARLIFFLVLCIVIAGFMVYNNAGSDLKTNNKPDNSEKFLSSDVAENNNADEKIEEQVKNIKVKAGKENSMQYAKYQDTETLKRLIQKLSSEKKRLEDTINILSAKLLSAEDANFSRSRVKTENRGDSKGNSEDTLFSGQPIYGSQSLYMNTENTVQNRTRAILKIVDADNYSDEIVSRINPNDKAVFQLGKKNIKHLAVIWKDRDSIIEKLNLLQKPEPRVSFNPSISQGESRINARTSSTVSLLRVKSVRPLDTDVKFMFEPEIGRELLNIKPEYRDDETIYKVTFNFRNKGQLEYFLDKYENKYFDPDKNNCFIKVSISVIDKITEKKFDNLDQAFKVFFYRYE